MRRSLSLLALAALAAVAVGSAAALPVNGGAIQAGIDSDLTCDADGVSVAGWGYEQDTGLVHSVRIGGISGDCVGNSLFVTVTSGGSSVTGSILVLAPTQVDPGTASVSFTPQNPADITALHVVIEGTTP